MDDLKGKVIGSLKWVGGTTLIVQLISWTITLYIIRMLSPEDMGLMGIAFVFFSIFALISELGLSFAVIQKRKITPFQLRQVQGFVIISNAFFFLVMYFGSPYISYFYNEIRLTPIVTTLGFIFVLRPFYVIQEALVSKEMNFKIQSVIHLIANLIAAGVSLLLALNGFGLWALVWNQLILYIVRVIGFNILGKGFIWPTFYFKGAGSLFAFGGYATGTSFFRAIFFKLDLMIAGKVLTAGPIGFYAVALQLSTMILEKLATVIPQVAFPAFSTIQDDQKRFSKSFVKSIEIIHIISFPSFLGLSAISPEIVDLFLGEKWHEVIVPMQILCLVMPLRITEILYYPAMVGKGRADICMFTALFTTIILAIGFPIGLNWGIQGLCWSWVFVYPLNYLFMIFNCNRILSIKYVEIFRPVTLPLIASLAMYTSIFLLRPLIKGHVPAVFLLTALLVVGVVVVCAILFGFDRKLFVRFQNLFVTNTR